LKQKKRKPHRNRKHNGHTSHSNSHNLTPYARSEFPPEGHNTARSSETRINGVCSCHPRRTRQKGPKRGPFHSKKDSFRMKGQTQNNRHVRTIAGGKTKTPNGEKPLMLWETCELGLPLPRKRGKQAEMVL